MWIIMVKLSFSLFPCSYLKYANPNTIDIIYSIFSNVYYCYIYDFKVKKIFL